ncbi:MAG: hypothetical protein ACRDYY_01950, partial [Acidimicrobiales bacterium]
PDPRTTMRHDRARVSLDRHATYIVATYIAGAARLPWRYGRQASPAGAQSHQLPSTPSADSAGREPTPATWVLSTDRPTGSDPSLRSSAGGAVSTAKAREVVLWRWSSASRMS